MMWINSRNKGFTLIELIVIMVIISIFVLFASMNGTSNVEKAFIVTNAAEVELAKLLVDDSLIDLGDIEVLKNKDIIKPASRSLDFNNENLAAFNDKDALKKDDVERFLSNNNLYILNNDYFFDNKAENELFYYDADTKNVIKVIVPN